MMKSKNALLAGDGSKGFEFTIGLRRHIEVAFRESVDFVGPDFHPGLPPGEIEIGVMPF